MSANKKYIAVCNMQKTPVFIVQKTEFVAQHAVHLRRKPHVFATGNGSHGLPRAPWRRYVRMKSRCKSPHVAEQVTPTAWNYDLEQLEMTYSRNPVQYKQLSPGLQETSISYVINVDRSQERPRLWSVPSSLAEPWCKTNPKTT